MKIQLNFTRYSTEDLENMLAYLVADAEQKSINIEPRNFIFVEFIPDKHATGRVYMPTTAGLMPSNKFTLPSSTPAGLTPFMPVDTLQYARNHHEAEDVIELAALEYWTDPLNTIALTEEAATLLLPEEGLRLIARCFRLAHGDYITPSVLPFTLRVHVNAPIPDESGRQEIIDYAIRRQDMTAALLRTVSATEAMRRTFDCLAHELEQRKKIKQDLPEILRLLIENDTKSDVVYMRRHVETEISALMELMQEKI